MVSEQITYYLEVQSTNFVALDELPCIEFWLFWQSFYRCIIFFRL